MLKNISNLGKALSKTEQKSIEGGRNGSHCLAHPWKNQPCIGGPGHPLSCPGNSGLVCQIASNPVDSICVCE